MSKKHKKGMKPVQVFIPEDLAEIAKERAKEFGMSLSEFLRAIIIAGVKYGLYLPPGEEIPSFKIRLSEEEINRIVEAIKEVLEEREKEKERKSILKKLLEWFR